MFKTLIKSLLPQSILDLLKAARSELYALEYGSQKLFEVRCGRYQLSVPKSHILRELLSAQPYRDLCIGVAAQHICAKYHDASILDVGDNVGDTAATIATFCTNRIIAVEGSDVFFPLLLKNVKQLPNEVKTVKSVVFDGSEVIGNFDHWGGTAALKERSIGRKTSTQRLIEIADERTRLVKLDTDGFDYRIILGNIDWLSKMQPAILLENNASSQTECDSSNEVFGRLTDLGYEYFIVWDDAGLHILSTISVEILQDLNRYLLNIWKTGGRQRINNFDILCLHRKDQDVYDAVTTTYRQAVGPPQPTQPDVSTVSSPS